MPIGFLRHFACTFIATILAWAVQLATFYSVASPSPNDRMFWAIWTGFFSLVGWVFVGLPIAFIQPKLRLRWTLMAVATSIALVAALVLGRLFGLSSAFAFAWIPVLACLTAAFAFLFYALALRWASRFDAKRLGAQG